MPVQEVPTCGWCREREADGGLDGADGPWCTRCRAAETALQDAKKAELGTL